MDAVIATFLWRRLEQPGHDACRLLRSDGSWRLEGTAVFRTAAGACCLQYAVLADNRFRAARESLLLDYVQRKATA